MAAEKEPRPYEMRVIGAARAPLRDFYHRVMTLSWPSTLLLVATVYLVVNALFAIGYVTVGGLANARPGSLEDAFFFSVQTMGTIGYGAVYPSTEAANALVVLESVVGLLLTALVTGLVFSKFARPTARIVFSRTVTIGPVDGVPTLALRIGNERGNRIVDAQLRVAIVRTDKTREGKTFYRMLDLKLARERALSLQRSFSILHVIDETSPLFGETPASLLEKDAELLVTVMGTDDIWMQQVHASHQYFANEIVFGARHVDVLSETEDAMILDLRKFHDIEPTEPIEGFSYRAQG